MRKEHLRQGMHSALLELHRQLSSASKPPHGAAGWSVFPARINACPQDRDSCHQGQMTSKILFK